MTIKERLEAIQKLENITRSELPYTVYCCFTRFAISGSSVSFSEDGDFMDSEQMKEVTAWMVENFGLPEKSKKK